MRKAPLIAALMLTALPACAQPRYPQKHAIESQRTIAGSYDVTWEAVIDVAAASNLPIRTIEKASGIIAFDEMGASATESDCGVGGWGSFLEQRRASVNLFVRALDATHTSVTVNARIRALWSSPGGLYSARQEWWSDCTSTGEIERLVLDRVQQQVDAHTAALGTGRLEEQMPLAIDGSGR